MLLGSLLDCGVDGRRAASRRSDWPLCEVPPRPGPALYFWRRSERSPSPRSARFAVLAVRAELVGFAVFGWIYVGAAFALFGISRQTANAEPARAARSADRRHQRTIPDIWCMDGVGGRGMGGGMGGVSTSGSDAERAAASVVQAACGAGDSGSAAALDVLSNRPLPPGVAGGVPRSIAGQPTLRYRGGKIGGDDGRSISGRRPTSAEDDGSYRWPVRIRGGTRRGDRLRRRDHDARLWAGATFLLTWCLIGPWPLGALITRARRREPWLAAAFFGAGLMILLFSRSAYDPWPAAPTVDFLNEIRPWLPAVANGRRADPESVTAANARIHEILNQHVPMHFNEETPLEDVLELIQKATAAQTARASRSTSIRSASQKPTRPWSTSGLSNLMASRFESACGFVSSSLISHTPSRTVSADHVA